MTADRNLLFGVLALQMAVIDHDQFVQACTLWSTSKDKSLWDILLDQGWLTPEDKAQVDSLLERRLKKHAGDVQASLAAVTDEHVRQVIGTLVELPSTIAYQPKTRDRYTLTRLHAKGGIGQIWVAKDEDIGREIALKELLPEGANHPAVAARFVEEARITGQLEHPGIVPVYELVQPRDQRPFYAMRLIKGHTLADAIKAFHTKRVKRPKSEADTLDLRALLAGFVAVCNAVAYAHSRGVLHRDLKPQNVVLGDFGEVIVLDWGLAKLLHQADGPSSLLPVAVDPEAAREQTLQGQVLGTPSYMPPEQAEGRLDLLAERSDVYGLGAVLYQLLTGDPPFTEKDTQDILKKVVHEQPLQPRQRVPTTPHALEAVCLKAMAKRKQDRYATAKELAQEVERWLADEPVGVFHEPWSMRTGRWVRRHRVLVSGTVALLVTTVVALALSTVLIKEQRDQKEAARQQAEKNSRRIIEGMTTVVAAFVPLELGVLGGEQEAAAAASRLPELAPDYWESHFMAGCLIAGCVPLAEKDIRLPKAKRYELANSYRDRAIVLLHTAIEHGLTDVDLVRDQVYLRPLYGSDNFNKLVNELEQKAQGRN
jgi:serine/threonine protein kinase